MADKTAKVEQPKTITFEGIMMEVNQLLVSHPHALDVGLFKPVGDDSHYYSYSDKSYPAAQIREKVTKLLSDLWQCGAYNYQQFADALRVDPRSIKGLLDEDFKRTLR